MESLLHREMLKLLADATVEGRNSLLSSRSLNLLPPSSVPGSDGPWLAASRAPPEPDRSRAEARTCAGRNRSTFKKILQILIMVVVQTTHGDALAVAL